MIKIKNVNLVNSELSMIMTIKKLTVQSRFQIFLWREPGNEATCYMGLCMHLLVW